MGNLLRKMAALGVALAMSLGAAPVMADEVLGIFQTEDGYMDYEVTLCGDGTQLCGKLVALHGKGDRKANRKYLGKYIVKELDPAGDGKWRGTITLKGKSAAGSVTIKGNSLTMTGCAYVVLCADLKLNKVS